MQRLPGGRRVRFPARDSGMGRGLGRTDIASDSPAGGPPGTRTRSLRMRSLICRTLRSLWRGEVVSDGSWVWRKRGSTPIDIEPPKLVLGGSSDRAMGLAAIGRRVRRGGGALAESCRRPRTTRDPPGRPAVGRVAGHHEDYRASRPGRRRLPRGVPGRSEQRHPCFTACRCCPRWPRLRS